MELLVPQFVPLVLTVVVGYLLGSVPVAVLVGRRHGVDPRVVGDRNPGYWNVKEQLGRRQAVPVFVGDALKGTAAALVGFVLGGTDFAYVGTAAAMIGHAWPVFAGFRGGRSILAFAGGMAVCSPLTWLVAVAALAGVSLVTRSFAVGVRVAVFGAPLVQLLVDPPQRVAATFGLLCIIGLRFALAAMATRGGRSR